MQSLNYTGDWQQLGTGLTSVIVSTSRTAKLWVGSGSPAAGDPGFKIIDDYPYSVPNANSFGGDVWVMGTEGTCTYVTA